MWEGWEEARHASALLIGLGQGGPAWDLPWEGGRLYFLGEDEDEDQPEDRRRSGESWLVLPACWVGGGSSPACPVRPSQLHVLVWPFRSKKWPRDLSLLCGEVMGLCLLFINLFR